MIFSEKKISEIYEDNLRAAKTLLKSIPFYSKSESEPKFSGLTGWVFEQTVLYCIQEELKEMKINVKPQEQVSLGGRATVDLLVGSTAIEIKTSGLFGSDQVLKYKKYKLQAEARNWRYVFLSIGETTYQTGIIEALGKDNVILLERLEEREWKPNVGEWARLIRIIADGVSENPEGTPMGSDLEKLVLV